MKLFGAAVATSFDTTLAGLACTIVLLIAQNIIRAREDALLTEADSLVEDSLLAYEQQLAGSLGTGGKASSSNVAALLGNGLEAITIQVSGIATSVKDLSAIVTKVLDGVGKAAAAGQNSFGAVVALQQSISTLSVDVKGGFAEALSQAKGIQKETKSVADQCISLANRVAELKTVVDKPRRVQIVETI